MKRYKYSKWFVDIMNRIPTGILRVLVLFFMMIGITIRDVFSACLRAILDDWNTADVKALIKDVWNWNDWGDHYNGKIG